jgi:methyl acetate hydrolase
VKNFEAIANSILETVASGSPNVPGVVAMVTDRQGTIYEGAAGYSNIEKRTPMATGDIFALFSLTKAITGTAVLQLLEQGLLDLDVPAAN